MTDSTYPAGFLVNEVQDAMAQLLGNLYDRWQDEKEYEDFNGYAEVMRTRFMESFGRRGHSFIGATKRPFGFKWMGCDGFERHTKINRNSVMTLRIAPKNHLAMHSN